MTKRTWFDTEIAKIEDDLDFIMEEMAFDYVNEIRRVMKSEHVSQAKLAKRTGKSRAYISQVLNYSPNLTIRSLAKIAIALGISLRWTRPRLVDKAAVDRLDAMVVASDYYVQKKTMRAESTIDMTRTAQTASVNTEVFRGMVPKDIPPELQPRRRKRAVKTSGEE